MWQVIFVGTLLRLLKLSSIKFSSNWFDASKVPDTFFEITNACRPVEGMVDRETQRAAWKFADGKNTDIITETGISNLTKDDAAALVHFGPERRKCG